MSKKITLIGVLLFALSFLTIPAVSAGSGDEIRIGSSYPLTGPRASQGILCKRGNLLAVEIINGQYDMDLPLAKTSGLPNLGGKKVKLFVRDHRGEPARGKAEAEKLITEDKVVGMVGSWSSGVTKTASASAEKYGIPFVTGVTASMELTKRGYKWFFRCGPVATHWAMSCFAFADGLRQKGEAVSKKVAVLSEDSEFGADQVNEIKRFAKEYGYEITNIEWYSTPPTSFDTELLRIKQNNPDLILGMNYTPGAIMLMQTLKAMNWYPKGVIGVGGAGYTSADFLKSLGKDAEDVLVELRQPPSILNKKSFGKQLNAIYKKMFGEDVVETSLATMTSVLVLANAINEAGTTQPEALRQALLKTDMPGEKIAAPWERIKFNPKTQQNDYCTAAMAQIRNGKLSVIWPFDLAEVNYNWAPWK